MHLNVEEIYWVFEHWGASPPLRPLTMPMDGLEFVGKEASV